MNEEIVKSINPNWYTLTLVSILILGIFMLFIKEIPENMKTYLIPGLSIYVLGTAIIGNIQGAFYRRLFSKHGLEHFEEPLWIYWILHMVWFLFLVGYLIFRGII